MKADEAQTNNKPKRVLLTKRGVATSAEGDKRVSFRYVAVSELKGRRRPGYDYLIK